MKNSNKLSEFDVISEYFKRTSRMQRRDVLLSIGDDCAITEIQANQQLVTTTDTLVEGRHFFKTISAGDLAHKAVAVNLSDLAAMGAEPAWISLAITLPHTETSWLENFSNSLFKILDHYNVNLIGGDTTEGKLSITITAQGLLPRNKGLRRSAARPGDWIYVTGTLGDSRAGLGLLRNEFEVKSYEEQVYLIERHLRPTPRVLFGQAIIDLANAAVDISDGLIADLGHILFGSETCAMLELDNIPLSQALINTVGQEKALNFALVGGEDYELCFTVSDKNRVRLDRALASVNTNYQAIGRVTSIKKNDNTSGSRISFMKDGSIVNVSHTSGFEHFRGE